MADPEKPTEPGAPELEEPAAPPVAGGGDDLSLPVQPNEHATTRAITPPAFEGRIPSGFRE
jgi:hypothetical protein